MNKYTSIYDLLPDALFVVDRDGNAAYGNPPSETDFTLYEHTCTLCEKEYTIKYFFTGGKKEAAAHFHKLFNIVLSLVSGSAVTSSRAFAHIYNFMAKLMKNEISENFSVSPIDFNRDFGSVTVNEKNFIAIISTVAHYLCKQSLLPRLSYFNDLFDFKVMLTCSNLKAEIPVFLQDFCCEAAMKNGFALCFDFENGDLTLTAALKKTCAEGSAMNALSDTFDYLYLICELLCI